MRLRRLSVDVALIAEPGSGAHSPESDVEAMVEVVGVRGTRKMRKSLTIVVHRYLPGTGRIDMSA